MHSYLLFASRLAHPANKELHIFDNERNYGVLRERYASAFPKIPRNELESGAAPATFESSPSYTASVMACPRMSTTLPPTTRFIVILRNPTSRVWSELMMKRRRVDAQLDLLVNVIPSHAREIQRCVLGMFDETSVADASPAGGGGAAATTPAAPPTTITADAETEDHLTRRQRRRRRRRLQDSFPSTLTSSSSSSSSSSSTTTTTLPTDPTLRRVHECVPSALSQHGKFVFLLRFLQRDRNMAMDFARECLDSREAALDCLDPDRGGKHSRTIVRETFPDVPRVLREEMRRLAVLRTSAECPTTPNPNSDQWAGANGPRISPHQQGVLAHSDAIDMSGCVGPGCSCFPRARIVSDISKLFIWRSMYYPQLVHCWSSLDRERFLVVDAERLRSDPVSVMRDVFRHARIGSESEAARVGAVPMEQVAQKFQQVYPEFEAKTGWSVNGTVGRAMPDDLRAELDAFFRPHNRKLFELLGVEPFRGWAV